MFARTTLLEIDTARISIDEAVHVFEESVVPRLRAQDGFLGTYALTTGEGRGMLITFWRTAEQADAGTSDGWYPSALEEFVTLFRSPPGREHYQVRVALSPIEA